MENHYVSVHRDDDGNCQCDTCYYYDTFGEDNSPCDDCCYLHPCNHEPYSEYDE